MYAIHTHIYIYIYIVCVHVYVYNTMMNLYIIYMYPSIHQTISINLSGKICSYLELATSDDVMNIRSIPHHSAATLNDHSVAALTDLPQHAAAAVAD